MAERRKRTGSEELMKKSFKKIWRFQKQCLPLHHFPLKKAVSQTVQSEGWGPEKTEDVLIAIYEQRSLK